MVTMDLHSPLSSNNHINSTHNNKCSHSITTEGIRMGLTNLENTTPRDHSCLKVYNHNPCNNLMWYIISKPLLKYQDNLAILSNIIKDQWCNLRWFPNSNLSIHIQLHTQWWSPNHNSHSSKRFKLAISKKSLAYSADLTIRRPQKKRRETRLVTRSLSMLPATLEFLLLPNWQAWSLICQCLSSRKLWRPMTSSLKSWLLPNPSLILPHLITLCLSDTPDYLIIIFNIINYYNINYSSCLYREITGRII